MNNYYVYGHFISGSNVPFYVGKGKGNRAWTKQHRNFLWNEVVKDNNYEVIILRENLTENEALLYETECVNKFGRIDTGTGILVNMTDGGNGLLGTLFTEESRKKFSDAAKTRWKSVTYKKNQSKSQINSWEDETIRSKRVSRMTASDVKKKNSQSKKEMWKNPEYRKKNLDARKKNWQDPEYRKYHLAKLKEGYYRKLAKGIDKEK